MQVWVYVSWTKCCRTSSINPCYPGSDDHVWRGLYKMVFPLRISYPWADWGWPEIRPGCQSNTVLWLASGVDPIWLLCCQGASLILWPDWLALLVQYECSANGHWWLARQWTAGPPILPHVLLLMETHTYRKVSDIRCTKSQNLNVSHLIL